MYKDPTEHHLSMVSALGYALARLAMNLAYVKLSAPSTHVVINGYSVPLICRISRIDFMHQGISDSHIGRPPAIGAGTSRTYSGFVFDDLPHFSFFGSTPPCLGYPETLP